MERIITFYVLLCLSSFVASIPFPLPYAEGYDYGHLYPNNLQPQLPYNQQYGNVGSGNTPGSTSYGNSYVQNPANLQPNYVNQNVVPQARQNYGNYLQQSPTQPTQQQIQQRIQQNIEEQQQVTKERVAASQLIAQNAVSQAAQSNFQSYSNVPVQPVNAHQPVNNYEAPLKQTDPTQAFIYEQQLSQKQTPNNFVPQARQNYGNYVQQSPIQKTEQEIHQTIQQKIEEQQQVTNEREAVSRLIAQNAISQAAQSNSQSYSNVPVQPLNAHQPLNNYEAPLKQTDLTQAVIYEQQLPQKQTPNNLVPQARQNYGNYLQQSPIQTSEQKIQQSIQQKIEEQQQVTNERVAASRLIAQDAISQAAQSNSQSYSNVPVQPVNAYQPVNNYEEPLKQTDLMPAVIYEQQLPQKQTPTEAQWQSTPARSSSVPVVQSSAPIQQSSNPFQQIYQHILQQPSANSGAYSPNFQSLWKKFSNSERPPQGGKRYIVIHPDGSTEYVDKLETVAQKHPNYLLVNGGSIGPNGAVTPPQPGIAPAVPASVVTSQTASFAVAGSFVPPSNAPRSSVTPSNSLGSSAPPYSQPPSNAPKSSAPPSFAPGSSVPSISPGYFAPSYNQPPSNAGESSVPLSNSPGPFAPPSYQLGSSPFPNTTPNQPTNQPANQPTTTECPNTTPTTTTADYDSPINASVNPSTPGPSNQQTEPPQETPDNEPTTTECTDTTPTTTTADYNSPLNAPVNPSYPGPSNQQTEPPQEITDNTPQTTITSIPPTTTEKPLETNFGPTGCSSDEGKSADDATTDSTASGGCTPLSQGPVYLGNLKPGQALDGPTLREFLSHDSSGSVWFFMVQSPPNADGY